MKAYQAIWRRMMESHIPMIHKALNGETEDFCYSQTRDKKWGTCDANYQNRLVLSYLLLFFYQDLPEPELEQLVRKLLEEELKDRETNSFQGIGNSLDNLSSLLDRYQRPQDQSLFQRAKNANFDCACRYIVVPLNPNREMADSVESAVSIALEMEEYETATQLISVWKTEQNPLQLKDLLYWLKQFPNRKEEKECYEEILKLTDDPWERCSMYQNYISILIAEQKEEKALELFSKLQSLLPIAKQNWHGLGLGRNVLETCMDLLLLSEQERQTDLWLWAEPYLAENAKRLHGNLYQKAIQVAKLMGSTETAAELQKYYDEMMQAIWSLREA